MENHDIDKKAQDTFVKSLESINSPITAARVDLTPPQAGNKLRLRVDAKFKQTQHESEASRENVANRKIETTSIAIVYQNRPIGEIEVEINDVNLDTKQVRLVFEQVATDMAFFFKRQHVNKELEKNRNLDLEWIGNCDSTKRVDYFIERASQVDFPVIIEGEKGTGKLLTAYSIHCHSVRKKENFIESHCANWQDNEISITMRSLWSKASGGTLYLKDIDALAPEQIDKINHYWRHVITSDQLSTPRLIVSISNTETLGGQKAWRELDYLSVQLPNLRDRREDIKELTLHYLEKLSHIRNIQLSSDCWNLFEQFDWTGNMQELERVVSKLVVMSDSNYVEQKALLAIIPQLRDSNGTNIQLLESNERTASDIDIGCIATSIAENRYSDTKDLHPALRKAILFLAENYTQDINLKQLSDAAFVSPSHLSYLFKHHTNSTFKQLLIQTRIEKAKQILSSSKHYKITEVAFDVGFHDLSHFEKTFKRVVGVSPGSYRK